MVKNQFPAMRRAAELAADKPFFLAAALRTYASVHNLDDLELAVVLGCVVEDLPRLALCRCPQAPSAEFRSNIQHLAARFGLCAEQLAYLLREVDSL